MWQKNDGTGEANILQNQFTAYLVTALHRQKVDYLRRRTRLTQHEFSVDFQEEWPEFQTGSEIEIQLPIQMQLENIALGAALERLKERDRYIFFARVLDERSFQELAGELGMEYKGVAAAYYRVIQKIKKEMRGDKE